MSVLHDLLHDVRVRYAAGYQGGLTNHLPMCLIALHELGAPDDRLTSFAASYAARLEPAAPWPKALAFQSAVNAEGADAVMRQHLRGLLPGLAGAAFHGVIRLAYAARAKDNGEIATALAYLADNTLTLETGAADGGKNNDLAALAEKLRGIEKPQGRTITERLLLVAANPRFRDVVKELAVDKSTLSQVSGLGARWYLGADDFASLHVLTGAHAVRTLRPWTADERAADRALAVAALACFVVSGCPARADARGKERADDREIRARAVASDDDHLQKLAVTCFDEEKAEEDQIYRIVCTRAARRGEA